MKKMEPAKSDVIDLLDLVWSNTNDGTAHSWRRLNSAMHTALKLTVVSGFVFAEGDVRHILDNYRSGYWIGDKEWVYTAAIDAGNDSCVASYEKATGREPIIADDARGIRRRLCVGAKFRWKGLNVEVTSFASDHCVACSYKPGNYPRKIDKRFMITRADVIADRAERKDAAKELVKADT